MVEKCQPHFDHKEIETNRKIRHQLEEDKLGEQTTMFGKDDDPIKGGKQEKGLSLSGGK